MIPPSLDHARMYSRFFFNITSQPPDFQNLVPWIPAIAEADDVPGEDEVIVDPVPFIQSGFRAEVVIKWVDTYWPQSSYLSNPLFVPEVSIS